MVGEVIIPIRDIQNTGTPSAGSEVVLDNGVSMFRATVGSMADAVRPVASQAEAESGTDNSKVMTAERVKQSIAFEVGVSVASASQGLLAGTAVQPSRTITAGTGLTGGGDLSSNRTVALNASSIASLAKADSAVQPDRTITAGSGLTGGGDLSANRSVALSSASISSLAKADDAVLFTTQTLTSPQQTLVRQQIGLGNVDNTSDANKPVSTATQSALNDKADTSRSISAGTGLTGGGDLTANRSLALNAASVASLAKADTAVQLGANGSMPAGGAVGQILAKSSAADYAVGWISSEAATAVSYGPQTLTGPQQTQAQTNLGISAFMRGMMDDTSAAAVWATLGGAQSLSSSGYAKLPNGLYLQWGDATNPGSDYAITFPAAFPTACQSVVVVSKYDGLGNDMAIVVSTGGITTIKFDVRCRIVQVGYVGPQGDVPVTWVAVGY